MDARQVMWREADGSLIESGIYCCGFCRTLTCDPLRAEWCCFSKYGKHSGDEAIELAVKYLQRLEEKVDDLINRVCRLEQEE